MKASLLALIVVMSAPAVGFAAGKNAWTQCGIGAMIFTKTGWAAAISNIIWDLGTTATSSSSTSPSQCNGSGSVGKMIYENYANFEEETAVGQGEHLTAMMGAMGCDGKVHAAILSDVRGDFLESVKSDSYATKSTLEKTESFFNNVMDKAGNKYAGQCSLI